MTAAQVDDYTREFARVMSSLSELNVEIREALTHSCS